MTAMSCTFCWGSHGCDKPTGHVEAGDSIHQCGTDVYEIGQVDPEPDFSNIAHSRYDESTGEVSSGLLGDNNEFIGWDTPEPMTNFGYFGETKAVPDGEA